jgi:SNF2 family DNA or RNA helicase
MKLELKRKAKYMANIVQLYWKNCEKIVKHNFGVQYE